MNMVIQERAGWLGAVPAHWEFYRGKYIFAQRNTKGNTKELQLLSPTQHYGVIPQEKLEELTSANVVKVKDDTDLSTFKTIHAGDYCISLRSFQGGFEYSEYEGVVSPAYQVFFPVRDVCRRYYKYLFKDQSFIDEMNSHTMSLRDGKNIAFSDFGNTYIPLPPVSEQIAIADYLDKKCVEIDDLIADIETELSLLAQYKQTVIIEAATHGLDNSVPMKDSGAGWMPRIPSHWRVDKFKYHLKYSGFRNPGDCEVLSLYRELGVVPKEGRDDNHNVTSEDTSTYKYVRVGDFVVNKMKAWQGSVAVSPYEGIVSPAYFIYRFTDDCFDKRYFHYLLRNRTYATEFMRLSGGMRVGQWDLPAAALENIAILIPPKDEQSRIAEYLDIKCKEIDSLIQEKEEELSVLREYRRTLIFESITGKKEVTV